ncbi:hypothetical protein ACHAXT_006502 [Thalassiosira profunda]
MLRRGCAAVARLPRGGRMASAGRLDQRRLKRGACTSCAPRAGAGRTRDCRHDTLRATATMHRPRPAVIFAISTLQLHSNTREVHRRYLSSSPNFNSGHSVKPVSEAQRRSAALELERMTKSTARLLDINITKDNELSAAVVNEARVALHYWARRWYMHFHPGFGRAAKGSALSLAALRRWEDGNYGNSHLKGGGASGGGASLGVAGAKGEEFPSDLSNSEPMMSGDYGAKQAERILDWALSHNLVSRGLFDNSADEDYIPLNYIPREYREGGSLGLFPNLACVNIMDTYLLPTAYGGVGGDTVGDESGSNAAINDHATLAKHFAVTPSYVRAVVDASRVMRKMKRLQTDFPDVLSPDTLSVKAELNVWTKRAIICSDGDAKEVLKSMESEDIVAAGWELREDEAYTLQGCLDRMESLLAAAEERYLCTKDKRIRPSVDWYNHLLGALARSQLPGALEDATRILRGMEAHADNLLENGAHDDRSDDGSTRQCHASPDTVSYNSVLFCLASHAGKTSAKEAEALLQRMTERHRRTPAGSVSNVAPDEVTYGAVLHALAQAGMAREAEQVLESLEEASGTVMPSLTIYNTVLNAWANCRNRQAPQRAEALLQRMQTLSATGRNPAIEPDGVSISTAISCHARTRTRRGAERGEEMLLEAIKRYGEGNSRVKPDAIMFNCAITGWTNISGVESERGGSGDAIPAERAERLLHKMKDSELGVLAVFHAQTFNIILDCWANSGIEGAAERSLALLKEMPDYGVTPDEISYNSALHAMTKESDPKWVHRAEDMFDEMKQTVTISQITYHVLMNIYGKCAGEEGARKAEELLRSMEKDGFSASDISYNICIDAYARRGNYQKAEGLLEEMISLSQRGRTECRPSIHSFASVINALAKSGDVDAVPRAEEVVRRVEELEYVSPNSILYNSLIDCIVKSRCENSASRADDILLKMEQMHQAGNSDVCPNSYAYSMVLTSCARSAEPDAPKRAERILANMERLYADGSSDAAANSRCYSAAISAWARSNSPDAVERALALIDRMEENGRDGSPHSKPNAHCYNAALNAIAKSQQPGKARICRDILDRMTAAKGDGFLEAAPSQVTYSTIINACAYTHGDDEDRKEAFDLARTSFQKLLESKDISSATFTNFFLVISRHLKHGLMRDQFAEAVFLEGRKRGKLDRQAVNCFRKASPSAANRLL